MSAKVFTHVACIACWDKNNPERPVLVDHDLFRIGDPRACCWCAEVIERGVWTRGNPEEIPCDGGHPKY